ncbi:hypothetical protein [Limnofasciculus baicalensis]|uniref:Uncharacterized protein n=1 Tax=Limnofasciculus baicalensis BBK-W-15 TaxID=2699891 RepID=A0AAE3GQ14_9CYAN|nr:hypothetical protein [Limnofasciculus baicalensis]MCP2728019.1 hypothetical protein [Limnofasciculus baicalensis BBK-W-15]
MVEINSTSNYSNIEVMAVKQLTAFGTTDERESLRQLAQKALQPRSEDYPLVFVPEVVEKAQKGYEAFWAKSPFPQAEAGQTEILVAIGKAEELSSEIGIGEVFPGGYRQIAHYLLPDKIWLTWKYVKPGETSGMAYDGLVWLEERFVWFPKPWRILAE